MSTQNILVEFTADISKMEPAVDVLERIGEIDKETADQFRKTNKEFQTRSKEAEKLADSYDDMAGSANKAASPIEKISKSFSGYAMAIPVVKTLSATLFTLFSVKKVLDYAKATSKAFAVQDTAEKKLLNALKGREEQTARLIKKAGELQQVSTIGDEAIIDQQAFLAALGLTEEQINNVISAAIDLSAGANMSLESSVRNLAKTYSGLTGELGEAVLPLRNLTQEQLKAGEGVALVAELYKGAGRTMAESGEGPVKQLTNTLGDLREEAGEGTSRGINVLASAVNKLAQNEAVISFFRRLGDAIGGVIGVIGIVVNGIGDLISLIPGFRKELEDLEAAVVTPGQEIIETFLDAENGVVGLESAVDSFLSKLTKFNKGELLAVKDFLEQKLVEASDKAAEGIAGIDKEINDFNSANYSKAIDAIDARLKVMSRSTDDAAGSAKELKFIYGELLEDFNSGLLSFEDFATGSIIMNQMTASIEKSGDATESWAEIVKRTFEDIKRLTAEAREENEKYKDSLIEAHGELEMGAFKSAKAQMDAQDDAEKDRQQMAVAGISKIGDIQSAAFGLVQANLAKEAQAIEDKYKRGLISEKEYQREKAKIQERQARANREAAIFNVILDTAQNVAEAFPNFILMALAGFIGATQIAAIKKTPIPKYRKGTPFVELNGNPNGIDTVPAMLTKGERVVTAQDNKDYWPILEAIHSRKMSPKEMASRILEPPSHLSNIRMPSLSGDVLQAIYTNHTSSIDYDRLSKSIARDLGSPLSREFALMYADSASAYRGLSGKMDINNKLLARMSLLKSPSNERI